MDGVLTDFNGEYEKLTGVKILKNQNHRGDALFFEPLNKVGKNFWTNMSWTKDGKQLWNCIKEYNPELLSAPTRDDSSRVGKHEWVQRELPNTRLILRSAKAKREFANENSVLIDDKLSNIEEWKKDGGIGIYHTSTENTIKELKKLGLCQ